MGSLQPVAWYSMFFRNLDIFPSHQGPQVVPWLFNLFTSKAAFDDGNQ